MYSIGIDLGGTNIKAAIADNGAIAKSVSIPTPADDANAVIGGLLHVCEMLTEGDDSALQSIGIGVPGAVNAATGKVLFTPNLPLHGVDIVSDIRRKYNCPVYIGNDASCAALGEALYGALGLAQSAVFITIGTGIGGGIILNKRLYTGINGMAGEFGHMTIIAGGRECGCGRLGCWESYASANGISRTLYEVERTCKKGSIDNSGKTRDAHAVFDAWRAGDEIAKLAIKQYIQHLAIGIANIIDIFAPETICIGGGVSNAWDMLEIPLRTAVTEASFARFSPELPQTQIVKAALGNSAGVIGAAMLWKQELS